jgi:hypothetical protein
MLNLLAAADRHMCELSKGRAVNMQLSFARMVLRPAGDVAPHKANSAGIQQLGWERGGFPD